MRKAFVRLLIACVLLLAVPLAVFARGNSQKSDSVLSVGATPVPHAELLNLIKDDLAAQGYTLRVVEFTDYVQPNVAVISGDLDANFFQHIPYLETNAEWSSKLVSAFGVHVEPFGTTISMSSTAMSRRKSGEQKVPLKPLPEPNTALSPRLNFAEPLAEPAGCQFAVSVSQ